MVSRVGHIGAKNSREMRLSCSCLYCIALFRKMGIALTACGGVRDILYNTGVITSVVKLIVRNAVGKLV